MIPQDLVDMLVCPECRKPVLLSPDGQSLKCGICRRVYPIQDDIPMMLLDVAKIDPA
jgi:LSD1 subclass zinc finger protein